MNDLLLNVIIMIATAGFSAFFVLRYFYKNSILTVVGYSIIVLALVVAVLTDVSIKLAIGLKAFIWAVPFVIALLVSIFKYLNFRIKKPLLKIIDTFKLLQQGDIKSIEKLNINTKDEFGEFATIANQLIDNFSNMSKFAQEIEHGNLETEFKAIGESDSLGNALLEMQKSLLIAQKEDQQRKLEDRKQAWVNEGHAKFGEILRNKGDNNNDLYTDIISNLVKYLNANQGGIFLINTDNKNDQYLELVAMYAYNRKKYINKRFEFGESLVGQCVYEGETIFMTNLPPDYINITSGLGSANPDCLVIVPLKFNDAIMGVIEIASFEVLEKHQINFIEKLGESIASTISNYKINQRTIKLLNESKMQSEELAAQEEEIRQNMEELQTTQEESARRERELNNIIESLNTSTLYAELDLDGNILHMNEQYVKFIGSSLNQALGKPLSIFFNGQNELLMEAYEQVNAGIPYKTQLQIDEAIALSTFSLVLDREDNPFKILNIGLLLEA